MPEYYHCFKYKNPNKVSFDIGVEVVLARNESLSYRAYSIKENEQYEIVDLRPCPLTRDKKPSVKGIEKQVKEALRGWVPVARNENLAKRLLRIG